jgi:hypothetical protein
MGRNQSYCLKHCHGSTHLILLPFVAVYFNPFPQHSSTGRGFARQFVAANDFIFWGNGVADRGVFNGSVFAREATLIPDAGLELEDNSRWARFLRTRPRHTLIYENALELVISPWWNLGADYLDVSPDFHQQLVEFSNAFYPATATAQAEQAFRGKCPVVEMRV